MKNELTKELHTLLDSILEVKHGYEQSEKDSNDQQVKNIFREIAEQKTKDAFEIKDILGRYDDSSPDNQNNIEEKKESGKVLQSLFTDKGEKSIIEHCIIDEKSLTEKYKSILSKDYADESIKTTLRQQLAHSYDHNTSLWEQSVRFKNFTI